jgi:leucyl/phenylalanyl-tRNA--protein transferase
MLTWLADPSQPLPDSALALPASSEAPGLLAAGGELTPARLREAYARGVFPWYADGQPVLWWAPDPRMVLMTEAFKLSDSLRKTLRRFLATPGCELRFDSAFDRVIAACATTPRHGQLGTWIVAEMQAAYRAWHRQGTVHSVETWVDGRLVGGLYAVNLGRMVFGESMFALATDASKIALAALVAFCRSHGVAMIDCQQRTGHLASLGAAEIPRERFEQHVRAAVRLPAMRDWTYDRSHWSLLDPRLPGPAAAPYSSSAPGP